MHKKKEIHSESIEEIVNLELTKENIVSTELNDLDDDVTISIPLFAGDSDQDQDSSLQFKHVPTTCVFEQVESEILDNATTTAVNMVVKMLNIHKQGSETTFEKWLQLFKEYSNFATNPRFPTTWKQAMTLLETAGMNQARIYHVCDAKNHWHLFEPNDSATTCSKFNTLMTIM